MSWQPEQIADYMNRLTMVEWDRGVQIPVEAWGEEYVHVYGWIVRDDGHHDFVFLNFPPWATTVPEYGTSSARHSAEIGRLIYGKTHEHHPCVRVADEPLLAKLVKRIVPWAARTG